MRTTIGLLSVVLFAAFPASAQEMVAWERFFPGEVGDYWQFEEVRQECSEDGPPDCDPEEIEIRTYTIVERQEEAGEIMLEIETGESRCRLSIGESNQWFVWQQLVGNRCLLVVDAATIDTFAVDEPVAPVPVTIGEVEHTVDAVKQFGAADAILQHFAADIGLYRYASTFRYMGLFSRSTATLQRAHIEGVEYGVPVAVEPEAHSAEAAMYLYPNPFIDQLTLRTEARAVRSTAVEVVDVTGRRVLEAEMLVSGMSTLDLTLLSPGVYVVRVVAPDGTVAVRRVTKVR